MPATRRFHSAGTQPSSHDLVCGSVHSLPDGLCPKGRTDSGRSYRVKNEAPDLMKAKGRCEISGPFFLGGGPEAPNWKGAFAVGLVLTLLELSCSTISDLCGLLLSRRCLGAGFASGVLARPAFARRPIRMRGPQESAVFSSRQLRILFCERKINGAEGRALPARPFCLHRGNRHPRRLRAVLEAEHDSGRHPQIVLTLRAHRIELIKSRQQIIHLCRANRKV
jgi:hypothetical protein